MVVFLLFCGVPQKTVAAITNYTNRQVRNIRDRFDKWRFSAGREEEGAKEEDKKADARGIVKYIVDHPRSTLFIADMVKKTEQAFVAGSVEAILTLFFSSKNL
ncbi:hypothetical protein CW713_10235 [Methanophagales archaeon]|nr:MAG: hypothetical protein CW713_10235 [Methanophagales archaeon]